MSALICVNCSEDAVFQVADPGAVAILYCRNCLPVHLHVRGATGQLPLPEASVPEDPSADETPKKKR